MPVDAETRFMSKIRFTDGCWLWIGTITTAGYGHFKMNKRLYLAHRMIYEHLVGPIPDGLTLDHLCRVRHCVNPAHLEPVTYRENVLRGIGRSAENARKTSCPAGHEYTPENTYRWRNKSRECRACHRERERRRNARLLSQ